MSRTKTALLSATVLLVAGAVTVVVFTTEPTAARGGATKRTAMLVEVTGAERGTFRPLIVATGTVRPEQDVVLSPRVGGQLVWRAPSFSPGAFVEKGEPLVRIDPSDYRTALEQQQAALRQARSELELERGRQHVAERELRLLDGDDLSASERARALREPQLDAIRGQVSAAQAGVKRARLDLRRTTVRAPFDGQVLRRDVSLGSQVAAGAPLGRVVGDDTYWVMVTVPHAKLRWLSFADGSDPSSRGSRVRIRNRGAWPEGVTREGYLLRPVGALDESTRMVQVIAEIPDPFARREGTRPGAPALVVGEFVETRIEGNEIPDVIRIDREHLRSGDTVWVMRDGALHIQEVDVVIRDERYAYLSAGLAEDARVVTTHLATVTEGAKLRLEESAATPSPDGAGDRTE